MPDPVDPPNPNPPAPDPLAALRAEMETLKTSLASERTARETAEAAKTALEREKMTEAERTKAELADAKALAAAVNPLKAELGTYVQTFENMYKTELEAVPEEKRALVEALSNKGSWADRMTALAAAKTLAGVSTAPAPMGAPLNPGQKPGGSGDTPPAFDPKNPPRLSDFTFKR